MWVRRIFLQILLQRTGVHADAQRDAAIARRLHHCPHAVLAPDVTGINAQTIDAKLGHTQRDLVVEMNVGHERYADLLFDFPKASAASMDGTDTRTMSAPASTRRPICATVAANTSVVSVLVMLWTLMGAPSPMGT